MKKDREFIKIHEELSRLKQIPDRDPEMAAAKRNAFLVQAEALREQGIRQPETDTSRTGSGSIRKNWLPKAAGILAALVLALGSVGGTVYASQHSLPDQILYPVKTLVEDTRLKLEKDPEDKLELETTFALRRMEEIQTLINRGQEVPERATRRLQTHLDQMLQQASRFQDGSEGQSMKQIEASFQEMNQVMNKLQTNNPRQGQEALIQVREKIQLGLEVSGKGSGNGQPQNTDQPGKSDQAPGHDPAHQPGSGKPDQPGEGNQNPGRDWEIPPGQDPEFTPGNGKGNSQ